MKILVTGANGFLGTAVVERLLVHEETDVRCLVRPGRDITHLQEIATRFPRASVEFFTGDLRSAESARRSVDGVDVVYHLAAGLRGSPADLVQNTVVASRNLLDGLIKSGSARVVLASSFGVYAAADLPPGGCVDEGTPLEEHPEKRDPYSFAKIRQERLFWEYHAEHDFPLIVLRPGVIYGAGGAPLSTRVGLRIFGLFFHFGRNNILPLTYVDNCAEALIAAGKEKDGIIVNVVDDDLPSAKTFLKLYRRHVEKMKYITVPYPITRMLSRMVEKYHHISKGQLPAVLTPYKSANLWKGNTFDNSRLKSTGWRQLVSTEEGMKRFIVYWRAHEETGNDQG